MKSFNFKIYFFIAAIVLPVGVFFLIHSKEESVCLKVEHDGNTLCEIYAKVIGENQKDGSVRFFIDVQESRRLTESLLNKHGVLVRFYINETYYAEVTSLITELSDGAMTIELTPKSFEK